MPSLRLDKQLARPVKNFEQITGDNKMAVSGYGAVTRGGKRRALSNEGEDKSNMSLVRASAKKAKLGPHTVEGASCYINVLVQAKADLTADIQKDVTGLYRETMGSWKSIAKQKIEGVKSRVMLKIAVDPCFEEDDIGVQVQTGNEDLERKFDSMTKEIDGSCMKGISVKDIGKIPVLDAGKTIPGPFDKARNAKESEVEVLFGVEMTLDASDGKIDLTTFGSVQSQEPVTPVQRLPQQPEVAPGEGCLGRFWKMAGWQ